LRFFPLSLLEIDYFGSVEKPEEREKERELYGVKWLLQTKPKVAWGEVYL